MATHVLVIKDNLLEFAIALGELIIGLSVVFDNLAALVTHIDTLNLLQYVDFYSQLMVFRGYARVKIFFLLVLCLIVPDQLLEIRKVLTHERKNQGFQFSALFEFEDLNVENHLFEVFFP